MYARLPPEPQRKQPEIDLFPDTQEGDYKPGLANYLDEFLSAIKVFGYLERPVFHELTRTMQTRKLIAGETLLLEQEKGFCLVVDGLVQIFVKSGNPGWEGHDPETDDEDGRTYDEEEMHTREGNQGYQLLTEVKNGAPMSSLFSILSLFTEDVKLRHNDETEMEDHSGSSSAGYGHARNYSSVEPRSAGFTPGYGSTSPIISPNSPRQKGSKNDRHSSRRDDSRAQGVLPSVPPLSLDTSKHSPFDAQSPERPAASRTRSRINRAMSVHPDILARATVDTTIAIIPATAFRRLTRVYPKATAHIVQVILTRLQRVTLGTSHSYLGLTSEVLQTENDMNRYTTYELPNFLRGSALDRLKEKFRREQENIGPEQGMKGIALHNAGANRRRRSSSGFRPRPALQPMTKLSSDLKPPLESRDTFQASAPQGSEGDANGVSPGDLLTSIQISRHGGRRGRPSFSQSTTPLDFARDPMRSPLAQRTFNPLANAVIPHATLHRQESLDEDSLFRQSILECMFKAIGLTNPRTGGTRIAESVEQSPRLV